MKTKGIGFFEQNIEKLVLASVGAVFLGVVVMQFMLEPNRIKVGQAEAVRPGQAYQEVEKRAREVHAKLERTELPADLPAVPTSSPLGLFRERRDASVVVRPMMTALGRAPAIDNVPQIASVDPGDASAAPVVEFVAPAPTAPVAFAYGVTIDPTEVVLSPELAKILPPEQPFDAFPVSVEATFDGTALYKVLTTDPDGEAGPARAMPTSWWRDNLEVLGVRLMSPRCRAKRTWFRWPRSRRGRWISTPPSPTRGVRPGTRCVNRF
jgi:hypothetical protein